MVNKVISIREFYNIQRLDPITMETLEDHGEFPTYDDCDSQLESLEPGCYAFNKVKAVRWGQSGLEDYDLEEIELYLKTSGGEIYRLEFVDDITARKHLK